MSIPHTSSVCKRTRVSYACSRSDCLAGWSMMSAYPTRDEEFGGTKPVEARHRIDEAKLSGWMSANVAGYAAPLSLLQFKGGQSNPTYQVETAAASYVLRRKPFGTLLPSAHAIEREFKVIAALQGRGFPVLRPFALCADEDVVGASF